MRQDRQPRHSSTALHYSVASIGFLAFCVAGWLLTPLGTASAMAARPPANASCAQLAHSDPSATNGGAWGTTILPGFGAPDGWFGVPVCANSINQVAPGGANVSCDRVPTNFAATGCAPGYVTDDGYGWSFQCVELVVRFTAWAFGAPTGDWRGDAQYLWLGGDHPASFTPYPEGGATPPVPGDILVWGSLDSQGHIWPAGPAGGHVAVVAATGGGSISFVEENMLGRAGNIPAETTTLTQSGGHWTIGRTYATNGGRALYGWLHESGNNGRFTGVGGQPPAGGGPSPAITLPSLAHAVTVTSGGALSQLVWSDTHTADHPAPVGSAAPAAVAQSLGAPPDMALAVQQRPAVVSLPDGARYIYALGQDGRLYAAYTSGSVATPTYRADVLWQDLGSPARLTLTSSASAIWDGRDIVMVTLASDGSVWTRSGPPGLPGPWMSLGVSPAGPFSGAPALTRETAPASASDPKGAWWLALAAGPDGALFEADGRLATSSATSTSPGVARGSVWSTWSPVETSGLPASPASPVFAFTETTTGQTAATVVAIGASPTGALWLLQRGAADQTWHARSLFAPAPGATLLDTILDTRAPSGPALTAYFSEPASVSVSTVVSGGAAIIAGDIPLAASPAAPAISWSLLGSLPPTAASGGDALPVAFSMGAGQSALLVSQGYDIRAIGAGAVLDTLAPGATISPATQFGSPILPILTGAGSVSMGAAPTAVSFSDEFAGATLDPRWVETDGPVSAVSLATGALALGTANAPAGVTLSQGALAGDGAISVWITPGESWRTGGSAQAGVAVALDAWNGVRLSIQADGAVALCPTVAGIAQPCQTAQTPAALDGQHGLLLRVTLSGPTARAAISADGTHWTAVGTWRAPWLPGAGAALGAYAPLVVPSGAANPGGYGATPLDFISASLFVAGDVAPASGGPAAPGSLGASARFSGFTVSGTGNGAA